MTKLPNFLIVGAAKSGTTSLYHYLRGHPQVFMPSRKEPSHFEPKAGGIEGWEDYVALFAEADGYPRVGEASVSYLMSPEAPDRIAARLGRDLDIVILLRNPVEMAYSLWGHEVREGTETHSFRDALLAEPQRLADLVFQQSSRTWISNLTYLARASYSAQVERYLARFRRDRIHIYLFEEFFAPGLPLFPNLCRRLGIDDAHLPEEAIHNPAGVVRSHYVRRVLTERMSWKEPLKRIIPAAARARMMAALADANRKDRPLPVLDDRTRTWLQEKLADDVQRLSTIVGRDLAAFWGFEPVDRLIDRTGN